MTKGKVKWYNEVKGFGFIEPENGNDIFVHRTGKSDSSMRLDEGIDVEFDIEEGDKGLMAVNVKIAE